VSTINIYCYELLSNSFVLCQTIPLVRPLRPLAVATTQKKIYWVQKYTDYECYSLSLPLSNNANQVPHLENSCCRPFLQWDIGDWQFHVASLCMYGIVRRNPSAYAILDEDQKEDYIDRILKPRIIKLDFKNGSSHVIEKTCPMNIWINMLNQKRLDDDWFVPVIYNQSIIFPGRSYQLYQFNFVTEEWTQFPGLDHIEINDPTDDSKDNWDQNWKLFTNVDQTRLFAALEYYNTSGDWKKTVEIYNYCETTKTWTLFYIAPKHGMLWSSIYHSIV
jgi:hypothetical protein